MERPSGVVWLVWLWGVMWVCCRLAATLLPACRLLSRVVRGRGPLDLAPTWSSGWSGRGRFGDRGVSMSASSIAARAAAAREGGGARSMTLSVLLIVL